MRFAFGLVGIVAALLIVWYLWLSKGTPPGQPPLTSLTQNNLDHFKNDFNGAGDEARLEVPLPPLIAVMLSRPEKLDFANKDERDGYTGTQAGRRPLQVRHGQVS